MARCFSGGLKKDSRYKSDYKKKTVVIVSVIVFLVAAGVIAYLCVSVSMPIIKDISKSSIVGIQYHENGDGEMIHVEDIDEKKFLTISAPVKNTECLKKPAAIYWVMLRLRSLLILKMA